MTLLTEHIYVLARIMIADPRIFLQLMAATASSQSKAEAVLYEGLLDQWWTLVSILLGSLQVQTSRRSTISSTACRNLAIGNFLPWASHPWYRPVVQRS
jgi:hypothetical protein